MEPTGTSTLDRIRQVAKTRRVTLIHGMQVDLLSAQMILKKYESLPPERQEKFVTYSIRKMFNIACKGL